MRPAIGFALIILVLGAAFYFYATLPPRLEAFSPIPAAGEDGASR